MRRVREHSEREGGSFTKRFGIARLVWYEEHQYVEQAIAREKAIKKLRRDWKVNLIERNNRRWDDLSERLGSWT